ncbi:hypothetical protein KHQ81_00815 [Mycoplasmatota bacterium]|nr:hypothetical protein KHQ81_00815 [Mycoplasmatota bacterium]
MEDNRYKLRVIFNYSWDGYKPDWESSYSGNKTKVEEISLLDEYDYELSHPIYDYLNKLVIDKSKGKNQSYEFLK